MDKIKNLLDERLVADIKNLSNLTPGTEEYESAVESLKKLYSIKQDDLRIELEKVEHEDKREETKRESKYRLKQFKQQFVEIAAKYGVELGLGLLTLIVYSCKFDKGLKFEETGAVCSSFMKNLMSNVKLKRK